MFGIRISGNFTLPQECFSKHDTSIIPGYNMFLSVPVYDNTVALFSYLHEKANNEAITKQGHEKYLEAFPLDRQIEQRSSPKQKEKRLGENQRDQPEL